MSTGMGKRLKNLKPFKKGQVANPKGAAAHKVYQFKKLNKEVVRNIVDIVTTGNVKELQKIVNNPDAPALLVAFASCMIKMINKGDINGIETMIQRVVGKVKDEVDVTSNGQTMPAAQVHVYLPANGRTKEENQEK